MPITCREFLHVTGKGVVGCALLSPLTALAARQSRFEAIAFDAFAIFDPRPVFNLAETLFPGKGIELSNAWRRRQFEYQWLRGLAGRYVDFWQTTTDALVFAAKLLNLELTSEKREELMQAYLLLKAWSEVPSALHFLRDAGGRLALLSNMTPKILETGIRSAGLAGLFEHVLSTDQVRTYKPDPRAYQLAIDAFKLERDDILFVAFAGWDAAGAKWFGYPTFWVNRLALPEEKLGVTPDATGHDLADLVTFVTAPPTSTSKRSGHERAIG
jgi:2-haloacid dehalogenase